MILLKIILCSVQIFTTQGLAHNSFSGENRQGYIQKAMDAFQTTPRSVIEEIYKNISLSERNNCKSLFENLTLNCLKTEASKTCNSSQIKNCTLLTDVILVNKLNEKAFVSSSEKLKLASKSKNYGNDYSQTLFRKYALLSTDFLLVKDQTSMAKEVDHYCTKHADSKGLSWQACVSALIWFVTER